MDKVIVITGCSSGLGYSTAKYLLDLGYQVIPTVRNETDLSVLPNSVQLDVTWNQSKIDSVFQNIIGKYKRIDCLINNAGFGVIGRIEKITEDVARQQMEVNFLGAFKTIKAVLPQMKKQHSGLIINVSSILGLFSIPDWGVYSASKFALEALSDSLNFEVSENKIKAVVVNPGAFKTKFYRNSKNESGFPYSLEGYGWEPDKFAALIEKIISTKNPKSQYIVGQEALKIRLLLALPKFIRKPLMAKYYS